jgi:RNA polymerase sigma factor (sigma-70 family)
MDAPSIECVVEGRSRSEAEVAIRETDGFEASFYLHFDRIFLAIARVTGDRACAEELAMETFWRFWRNPQAHGENAGGWLYRTAVHLALGELRRRARHARYERFLLFSGASRLGATPEKIRAADEEQEQVRRVLATIPARDAELLLLRANDVRYEEIAVAMGLNVGSVGTLVGRAKATFRKEYVKRYGEPGR